MAAYFRWYRADESSPADNDTSDDLLIPKDLLKDTIHMPRRIPGESQGDFEAREADLPPEPDEVPPGQEGGQAGINDITRRAGFPQKQAGAEEF